MPHLKCVVASDGNLLAITGIYNQEECTVEARLDLSDSAQVDQETVVHPEEPCTQGEASLYTLYGLETVVRSSESSMVACHPQFVVYGFRELNFFGR